MRIGRLNLLRYGRFTNLSLEFPPAGSDLHVIFGPNEAGKSTCLSAIEDLLFGIPHNSPYNFLHDYASMRVAGLLNHDGNTLEFRRRKGRRDTLLGPDDAPLPSGEAALAPFLGGADQAFFTRMFSLNHDRLAKGGREILEAKDEVGQMLFSASAGITDLHERVSAFTKEAESLWAPRRARNRAYYQASDALKEAESALREHTITANKWHEMKRAFDAAQHTYEGLNAEIESLSAEQRKLSRIRRVYRSVNKLSALTQESDALADIRVLPEDADTRLETATQEELNARSRIDELTVQLDPAKGERADLSCDATILMRADDIQELHKKRIEVQKEKADLPQRRAELEAAEAHLDNLARELGWSAHGIDGILARLPQRATVTAARTLHTARGERASAITSATTALEDTQAEVKELQRELGEFEDALDVSHLAAVISTTRELGDIATKIIAARNDVERAEAELAQGLQSLRPQVASERALTDIPVPPRSVVQDHRDSARQLEQAARACDERIRAVESELAQRQKDHDRLLRNEDVVPPETLARARKERDDGWALIRRHYIDGNSASEKELKAFRADSASLPAAYESKVATADSLADDRFDKAQAAGEIAAIARQIEGLKDAVKELQEQKNALYERAVALNKAWGELWAEAPFDPLAPDFMLTWLENRTPSLELIERRKLGARQVSVLQQQEHEARSRIIAELTAQGEGVQNLNGQPLRVVIEAATAVQRRHEIRAERKSALEGRIRKLEGDQARKKAGLDKVEAAWREWQGEWSIALKKLKLDERASLEAVADQLNMIEEMRGVARDIDQLRRERIDRMERDIKTFAGSVADIVTAVASDLAGHEPDDAVLTLENRLDEARRIRRQQEEKDKTIASLEERISECEKALRNAQQALRELQELAGVDEITQLRGAITKSRRKRKLDADREQVKAALASEGDGLPLAELHEECKAVDLDQVAAREDTLQTELKQLRDRLTQAAEQRAHARQAFEAIGGEHHAAHAAAARQEALASMREVAEQYVCVRTAATLLEWAIDGYRRKKQAPLLKQAGQIFSTLTLGVFKDLRVEFDDQDRAQLAGTRPDETSVNIAGMSGGTADQLYLALRLAAVDEYLTRAHALPFVADDLLINFDDTRAAAGFKVLAQLGLKTQVLFFTHHQHLVDIARATLGESINIISMSREEILTGALI